MEDKTRNKIEETLVNILIVYCFMYAVLMIWFEIIGEPILSKPCKEEYGENASGTYINNSRMCYFTGWKGMPGFKIFYVEYLPYPQINSPYNPRNINSQEVDKK